MTVAVSEGTFWTSSNEHQEFVGGTSPTIAAPVGDAKWVLVTVTPNGALNIVDGVASANPVLPDPSTYKDELPLAALFIGDTVTAITNDMVFDIRPLWSIPPDSISQDQLNDFATVTQLTNGLATKAGVDGTNAETFTISVGTTSVNNSGFFIDRSAGPDVGIRFNEAALVGSPPVPQPQWEFTNDGTSWNAIGVSAGSYYLKTVLDAGALDFRYYTQNELGVAGVLDSRYYEQTIVDASFAPIVHTHLAADITDFPVAGYVETINSIAPVLGDVELDINDLMDVKNQSPTDKHVLVFDTGTSEYINRALILNDLDDVDTISAAPVNKDFLIYNGGTWINRPMVKADMSDFLGNEFLLLTNVAGDAPAGDGVPGVSPDSNSVNQDVYGVKTFYDGLVIEGTLVVNGVSTSINTGELTVADPHMDLNFGEAGTGVGGGSGTSGFRIDRGTEPYAFIQWDEAASAWEAGVDGVSVGEIVIGGHVHDVIDITDFGAGVTAELALNDLDTLQDVTYLASPHVGDHLIYNFSLGQWENKVFADDVKTELNINTFDELSDVTYPSVATGDFLQWSGVVWSNHVLVKADITNFVETDYIHTFGDETKSGALTIDGNFTTVGGIGTVTKLESENVNITSEVITLNVDETLDGGFGVAGFEINRGPTFQKALLHWHESPGHWDITVGTGATLVTKQIETTDHIHVLVDITDISVTADEVDTLNGITTGIAIQTQLDDKISRAGDTMDALANLTFNVGQVLGLPALPIGDDAASSKKYVDDQILIAGGNLTTHIADMDLHMTVEQNAYFDGLALTGSPVLTAADTNQLIGIAGNVQALLDLKTDLTVFNAHDTDMTVHMTADQNTFLDALNLTGSPIALTAADVNQLEGITGNVQVQIDSKIGRAGDTMDNLADLTFDLGEVLGLPAIPSVDDAAASKKYVDDEIIAENVLLTNHISDDVPHMDANQNTFMDGLALPTLTSAEVNFMVGVTSLVQTQLDNKTIKTIPAATNNLAALNALGELVDSGVLVNDSGTGTDEIWTADKIDTTKADKVSGAVLDNFASLDASGNLLDSGFNDATYADAIHTHVASDVTDFSAAADLRISIAVLDDLSNVAVPTPAEGNLLQYVGGVWVNKTVATVNVDYASLAGNNTFTGINQFNNNVDITGTGNLTVAGDATVTGDITVNGATALFKVTTGTFSNDVVIGGDLTVQGTTTTIGAVDLLVTDKNITVNNGYSGSTTGSNGAGIHVVRNDGLGSPAVVAPQARLVWEELVADQGKWKAGIEGVEDTIALEGVTKAQPDYALVAGSGAAAYTLSFVIPVPAAGKTGLQVFVNGIKQIEGAGKAYTVAYAAGSPAQTIVTFNAGSEPIALADVEFYGFGYIG